MAEISENYPYGQLTLGQILQYMECDDEKIEICVDSWNKFATFPFDSPFLHPFINCPIVSLGATGDSIIRVLIELEDREKQNDQR